MYTITYKYIVNYMYVTLTSTILLWVLLLSAVLASAPHDCLATSTSSFPHIRTKGTSRLEATKGKRRVSVRDNKLAHAATYINSHNNHDNIM